MCKPQLVGGVWRKPIIQAKQKKELKNFFDVAGVPWIYSKERAEIHATSTYNRRPKGTAFSNNYETRLAMIRKNLATQPERLHKLRLDRQAAKPNTDDEATFLGVLKALKSEAGADKFAKKRSGSAAKSSGGVEIEKARGSPVKKQMGASKGGQISKKEREVMGMASGTVAGKKEEDE